jgi:DNA-binding protein H-NS
MNMRNNCSYFFHEMKRPGDFLFTFFNPSIYSFTGSFSLSSLPGRQSMAKRAQTSQDDTLELYGDEGTTTDRLRDIENLLDALSVQELRTVRVLAGKKQREKLEETRNTVLAEVEGRVKALGLSMKDVFPSHKPSTKAGVLVKYRSPAGDTWSGRGHTPTWLRTLEAQGHTRDEFRVTEG